MAFQDAEQIVIRFWGLVTATPAGRSVPGERPRLFIRSWRTGGVAVNRVLDAPIITTQVWGTDPEDIGAVVDLSLQLRDALYGRSSLMPPVRRIEEVTGLYDDVDPDSDSPRYTFASRLFIRAAS